MTEPERHVPVLEHRVLELLEPVVANNSGAVIVDATLGLGGHSEAILRAFSEAVVVGFDRDPEALRLASERLAWAGDRFTAVHAVYDQIAVRLDELNHPSVDAVFFDLGVSSMQLDEPDRGFAYSRESPLDMRMDPTEGSTAADILNTYDVDSLTRILREYGEEKFARRIAQAIVKQRETEPLQTSVELVRLIGENIPAPARRTGGNPAKRTFQALRIEVNDELAVYRRALPQALDAVAVGGRVIVLAYHSLEDRITKQIFAAASTSKAPPGLPVEPANLAAKFALRVRGAEKASATESASNPRAKSVRLRAIERLAA